MPFRLHTQSICTRHRSFVLSKCKSLSDNHVDPQQTHATRFLTPWGNSLHLLSCLHTLCDVYVFDYRLFRMEESQWVRVLFQLKIIIRDLHWGRKINVWSFSSVSLNMEDVSRPSTSHPCPCPLLCLHLILQPKMKGGTEKGSGREGEKKIQREGLTQCQIGWRDPFCIFQLG